MEPARDLLTPDTTIREAVTRMRMAVRMEDRGVIGVKAMLVEDPPGHAVGMLSMIDILKAIIPWYMKEGKVGGFTWDGMLAAMARKVADRTVGEVMSRNLVSVHPDTPLMECADIMAKRNFQRLPVIDSAGRLQGIVYLRDLYHAIVKVFSEEGN
jgi:CBS domain-containing protein